MTKITFTVINDLTYDQRMHKICESLSKAGYSVILIGRKLPSSLPIKQYSFEQKRIKCFINKGKLFYLEYNIRLLFFLLFTNSSIFSAVDLDTILPNLFISKLKGKKLVFDAHEYFSELPEVVNRKSVKKTWEKVGKFAVPKADLCYTVNHSLVKVFKTKYHCNFNVIQNVPLLSKNAPVNKEVDKHTIIYQGWINKGRGLEFLVHAMHKINAHLIIAGGGDIQDQIENLVIKEKLSHKIEITGFLHPEKLALQTQRATIGYNLLDAESLNYFYSLSNKFFSYIHQSIPSISSNFPEYRQFNELYEVCLLSDLSEDDIVKNINLLINNKELYEKLRNNCLIARKEFSWQKEEIKLLDLYRDL